MGRTGSAACSRLEWSDHPVTRQEALDLLSAALDHNGYTLVREGRILKIYTKAEGEKEAIPVRMGRDADQSRECLFSMPGTPTRQRCKEFCRA